MRTIILDTKERELANNLGLINHVGVAVDCSSSMAGKEAQVIKVVDDLVRHLAITSDKLNQETRITLYMFNHTVECVTYDKDVLRLPSIQGQYRTSGATALIDATFLAVEDLKLTATKYGDHGFLIYVITDGENNRFGHSADQLSRLITGLGPQWTLAALVPNMAGKAYAMEFGFPEGNVAVWDVDSATGVADVGVAVAASTDSYMTMRAAGKSGTRTLFSTAADAVNAKTIQAAGLKPLAAGTYDLITVPRIRETQGVLNKDKVRVRELSEFVTGNGLPFVLGHNYYRLRKKEMIKGDKQLAVREKATNKVFVGAGVRAMIGLSDKNQSVAADFNPDYDLFVQSKSNNRHLFTGDEIMVLK